MSQLPTRSRIAALDGWRGIAIALVLFSHVQVALLHRYLSRWSATGYRGVSIFFVLSGFLITSTLLESPDLKRFYVRRFFRLMPAAWTYLAALAYFSHLPRIPLTSAREVLACLFFFRNFLGSIGNAGHFWSLSIEEQFYLFWPCALVIVGRRRGIWLAAIGALCGAIIRAIFWDPLAIVAPTWCNIDGLFCGCTFALLVADTRSCRCIERLARCWPIALFAYALSVLTSPVGRLTFAECLCMGLLISGASVRSESLLSKALSFVPLRWLGRVSYSVYLWQAVFMGTGSALVLCTLLPVFSLCSYYFIEKPLTAFGRKLAQGTTHVANQPLNATLVP